MLRVLDLFSGIGGFSLGLEWTGGFETVAFCEIEKYPQEVLTKNFPGVPIYDDIQELTAVRLVSDRIGRIDVITGGYPCTPFSSSGLQLAESDERYLWPEMYRLIKEIRPRYVIAENVAGHVRLSLSTILRDLEMENYRAWAFLIPASAAGANHTRERVWIIGQRHATATQTEDGWYCECCGGEVFGGECKCDHGERLCGRCGEWTYPYFYEVGEGCSHCGEEWTIPNPDSQRRCLRETWEQDADNDREPSVCQGFDQEGIESKVDRVVNGFPGRVAKLKALGNSVVPQIPMMIGQAILDYEQNQKV